jgi:uncharacterized RDD family membrane protein YckC
MTQLEPAHILKRLTALAIDLGFLYVIGMAISSFLGNYLMYLGPFKIIIGIIISTVYFTLAHSTLFKGKSIGKKLFGLQVIGLNGSYLSIGKSFLRTIIFTVPYCYSDLLNINFGSSMNIYQFLSYTIIPASLFINHAFIFTNPLRRCFNDIVVNSVVTDPIEDIQFETIPVNNKLKFLPILGFILVVGFTVLMFNPFSEQNLKDIRELKTIESKITNEHHLYFSKFFYEFSDNDETNKTLKIECYIPKQDADMSSEVYLLTEELAPFKDQYKISKITLNVVKDFNIGIYSHWEVVKKDSKKMKFDL